MRVIDLLAGHPAETQVEHHYTMFAKRLVNDLDEAKGTKDELSHLSNFSYAFSWISVPNESRLGAD